MKKFIVILILWVMICIDVPQNEIDRVNDVVVDHEDWLFWRWKGKARKTGDQIMNKEIKRAISESEALPAGRDAIIDQYMDRPGRRPRKDRDE